MKKIELDNAPADIELEVLEINAGRFARKRLMTMGIQMEDKLIKFNDAPWGPVLIRNVTSNASKIAIGRRLAHKILVRYEET